jgi:RNA polymerase sigma-70 factor (ECF subfamily)
MGKDKAFDKFDGKEEFLSLLAENQRKLFSYIMAVVGRRNIAEDIMQQTLLIMWRDFCKFEKGTNFSAWGKKIAYYRILTYQRQNAKLILLDGKTVQEISDLSKEVSRNSDERAKALEGCMKKLKESNLRLIVMRYHKEMSCKEISETINRPIQTVYKSLARTYTALKSCIDETIVVWNSDLQ